MRGKPSGSPGHRRCRHQPDRRVRRRPRDSSYHGDVPDVGRFPDRDHFAAYYGTAPVEASSGKRKVFQLSRRGNRRMNHAIRMAAVTQIHNRGSDGRAYYDKKRAEGKTGKEALRGLKRRVSDAIYRQVQADARRTPPARAAGPGGQAGNVSASSAAGSHPSQPATSYRSGKGPHEHLTTKRNSFGTP